MQLPWIPTVFAVSAVTLAASGAMNPAEASTGHNDPDVALSSLDGASEVRIYGGEKAKTCEFPQTISVGGCTGTLVHPRVILSAAHCGNISTATFGESGRSGARRVSTKWCERSSSGGRDAQICVLSEAVNDVPATPIAQGCELDEIKVGGMVLLSGFGYTQDGVIGTKHWVETDIRAVKKDGLDIHIGGTGPNGEPSKGGCNGDSGGPAFIEMKDGTWRTIGATHAGADGGAHPNCKTGIWKSTGKLIGWYEEMLKKHNESDIDLSPCFNDSGEWEPNENCGGYVKDLKGPYGTWEDGCGKDAPTVKYSATCGEPFAPNPGDEDKDKDKDKDDDKGGDKDKDKDDDKGGDKDKDKDDDKGGDKDKDKDDDKGGDKDKDKDDDKGDDKDKDDDKGSDKDKDDDKGGDKDKDKDDDKGGDKDKDDDDNDKDKDDDGKGGCSVNNAGNGGVLGLGLLALAGGFIGRRRKSKKA